MKKISWVTFGFLAVVVGLYPVTYLLFDMSGGLLSNKSDELLTNSLWNIAFYAHIYFGGIALLTGWTQFSKKIRNRRILVHRVIGYGYTTSVLISGTAALYISFYATGGPVASLEFGFLAVVWLISTVTSYLFIRNKNIKRHQRWMIRSYALTFAAVTLRIWLPLMQFGIGMDFIDAYRIVAWLSWIPNLAVAEVIVAKVKGRIRGATVA